MTAFSDILIWGSLGVFTVLHFRFTRRTGKDLKGRIRRAVGPLGSSAIDLAIGLMMMIAIAQSGFEPGKTLIGKAAAALGLIIAADDWFNGGDPPKRKRRRAKVSKMFARFAPVKAG